MIMPYPSCSGEKNIVNWENVQDKNHSFVFELEVNHSLPSLVIENLSDYEFLYNEKIAPIRFSILHFPSNVTSITVGLEIISPTGRIVYANQWECQNKSRVFIDCTDAILLNESGIWQREWSFRAKSGEYDRFIEVYENIDEKDKLADESKIKYLGYGSAFEIRDRWFVYTLSEYTALIIARANREAAKASEESAKANKDALSLQKNAIDITSIAAIATAVMAVATAVMARYTKKSAEESAKMAKYTKQANEELQKEIKKPGIIKMIAFAINPSILEFTKLKEAVEEIKEGHISDLPNTLKASDLDISYWKDFRKEFKILFEKIQKYLEDKEKYTERLENTIMKIKEILEIKKETIEGLEDFLEEMTVKYNYHLGVDAFFDSISISLARDILYLEYAGINYHSKKVFEKFKEEWLKIREEEPVKEEIVTLIEMGGKFNNYVKLIDELREERNELMEDYKLQYTDIEVCEQGTIIVG